MFWSFDQAGRGGGSFWQRDDEDEEDHLPFEDDGNEARGLKSRTDGTAPYLEVGVDEPSGGAQSGMAANPGLMHDESSPDGRHFWWK